MKKNIVIILSLLLIVSCASRTTPAPIVNVTKVPTYLDDQLANPKFSKSNETFNNTDSDTTLGSVNDDNTKPVPQTNSDKTTMVAPANRPVTATANKNQTWISPTNGRIIRKFTTASKGIDYTGKLGQDIVAINDGKVVYSGNGLKGYGNLIIIKHDKTYLSAYANNQANMVREGETVKRGQKIAIMGKATDGEANLHFEIRQSGKPIEPSILLK